MSVEEDENPTSFYMRKLFKIITICAAVVADFFKSEAALIAKGSLEIKRLLDLSNSRFIVLVFTHRWGGGIERHLLEKARQVRDDGRLLILLRPARNAKDKVEINSFESLKMPSLKRVNWRVLSSILSGLPIEILEVHSLMGWPFSTLSRVKDLASGLGISYDYYVHDFMAICPQVHLVDHSSWYCNEKGEESCRICMSNKDYPRQKVHLPPFPRGKEIDITEWKYAYGELFGNAFRIYAPSRDAASRIQRYYPNLIINVVPHPDKMIVPIINNIVADYRGSGNIRIAFIGAIRGVKGSNVLLKCAENALKQKFPFEFVVIGTTNMSRKFKALSNVFVTGKYRDEDVYGIVQRQKCHIAFFPSVCPETYSYSLSIALNAGFHCFVFDIGAQAERLRDCGKGTILPISKMTDPYEINKEILSHFS